MPNLYSANIRSKTKICCVRDVENGISETMGTNCALQPFPFTISFRCAAAALMLAESGNCYSVDLWVCARLAAARCAWRARVWGRRCAYVSRGERRRRRWRLTRTSTARSVAAPAAAERLQTARVFRAPYSRSGACVLRVGRIPADRCAAHSHHTLHSEHSRYGAARTCITVHGHDRFPLAKRALRKNYYEPHSVASSRFPFRRRSPPFPDSFIFFPRPASRAFHLFISGWRPPPESSNGAADARRSGDASGRDGDDDERREQVTLTAYARGA